MLAFLPTAPQVEGNVPAALVVLFALIIGHAFADFALQSDFLARAKVRDNDLSDIFPKGKPRGIWLNSLFAHALVHAGFVWLLTGSVAFALLEWFLHSAIDFLKGEGKISFSVDQALHRLCKIAYVVFLYLGFDWVTWCPA